MTLITTLCAVLSAVAQRPDTNWFLTVAPIILESAVEGARPAPPSGRDLGTPLLVNLPSFVVLGSMATGSDLSSGDVARALGRTLEDVTPGRAFECRRLREPFDCHVLRDGLYVELNHFMRTPEGYEALVTTKTTGPLQSDGSRMIDSKVVRILFTWENGKWLVTKREIVAQT